MSEIIKCNKCGQVLVSGVNMSLIFGKGTSIECRKCGNKYVFGLDGIEEKENLTNPRSITDERKNR